MNIVLKLVLVGICYFGGMTILACIATGLHCYFNDDNPDGDWDQFDSGW